MGTAVQPFRWCGLAALVVAAGCGKDSGPKTYPVTGTVVFEDGDVGRLVGGYVRFESVTDPNVKAVGEIEEGGTFVMGTFVGDKPVGGVLPGQYRARVDLPDGDDEGPRPRGKPVIHPRFRDFKTSGLEFTVAEKDNTITIQVRQGK